MNILRFFHKNKRKGFTLIETLVTVGLVAVLCGIAIPSIITMNRSMNERELENSARAVYLAAQSNLAQMRSSGDLEKLAAMTEAEGAHPIRESGANANLGEDWNEQLRYTVTGADAFDLVLPVNVLDSQLREQQILIEYNPFSGHVYAVFYSEGEQALSYSVIGDRTNEAALKEKGIGYYCGGSVTITEAEVNSTAVTLTADTDGQELIASVVVPVPGSYTNHQDKFHEYLSAKITIRGELSGAELVIPTDSLALKKELCIGSPNYIEFTFILDSLNASNAFAALNSSFNNNQTPFTPGENLTIFADVQFNAPEGETILTFDEVVITGVNSLFAEMKENKDASGNVVSYEIELSNGRHLQNLNALPSAIASAVAEIKLVDDIYWNETAEYYREVCEQFTPISNAFSSDAVFDGSETDGNYRILYLNIDVAGDAGLFSTCSLKTVSNLAIVSPAVKGTQNVGALTGAATGVTFSNCSVYIDTEDEYFSWDMMDEYGITSSGGTAGGLVGYATNGSFANCFAAVNVDAAENAGGFVGYSEGANASMCYASGNVTGKIAGGFVGYSKNETYKQCFASGDVEGVDIAGGFTGKMECTATSGTYNQCYAVGAVKVSAENGDADGFCGTSNLDENDEKDNPFAYNIYETKDEKTGVYSKTYYLSDSVTTKESYYADSASYAQLAGERDENNLTVLSWTDKAVETHSYSLVENGEYPFLVYSDELHYYGEWPEEECPVALAYYEKYKDDEKSETKEIGFYISGESDSTLQHDRTIVEDGYVLLCQTELSNAQEITIEGSDLPNAYKVYDPAAFDAKISSSFYDKVVVTLTIENVSTTFTLYYNPNFALTQLNPSIDEAGKSSYDAKLPTTADNIPSKIYIRTARHLAAIANNTAYQGSSYNYVQMLDVDFGAYKWGTENNVSPMKSIAEFAGTYTCAGSYTNQAKIVLKDGITLFDTVTGKVSDVDVVAAVLGTAEAGFVLNNKGEIVNCTVGSAGNEINSGYPDVTLTYGFAKANSGTIRGCMANTGATNAAFVGENNGTIADCYAWYPGTTADGETKIVFAESGDGEIISSYAAIYAKLDADNKVVESACVLVYDRVGDVSFRDTLNGITLGESWYSYSDAIIEAKGYYPYSTPEGISHRGGWDKFTEYEAFTGYYYYETYADDPNIGVYIATVGETGKEIENTLKGSVPATTAYGIFKVTPPTKTVEDTLEETALTLNSAPIVPSALENEDNEEYIKGAVQKAFGQGYTCTMLKELSSQSVYVLNGTTINTWFAPANEDGAYRIRTAEQFAAIREFPGGDFVQELPLTLAAPEPIAYFTGTYDGGQNTITYANPLTVTLDAANGEEVEIVNGDTTTRVIRDNVAYGLFANVTGETAVIKNCRVVGAEIVIEEVAPEEITGVSKIEITAAIGGLVGENHGTVRTSSVEGLAVTHTAATNVPEDVSYIADIALGGLVGRMADGRMDECFVTGEMTLAANAGDAIGGAVGIVAAEEDTSVTCVDSYAAVNINASGGTVGAFVGEAENGTFYYCHGWNGGAFIGAGADKARLLKCYYAVKENGAYKIWTYTGDSTAGYLSYESLTQWVKSLNDERGDIWDTKTTVLDENGKETGEKQDVQYPVLSGRYDANAVGTPNLYKDPEIESAKLNASAATEAPAETTEQESTPEATEQPDATPGPEVTPEQSPEPEITESPEESTAPEITPEPTAEPTPVPTETPTAEVTPEPAAETEPVNEEA